MILNLLTVSVALFGLAACGGYGGNGNYAASNSGYGGYHPAPRHHMRRNHWRRRSSSESDEKWDCARLGVFNVTTAKANLFSAPKIAYYTSHGEEKAIIVCQNPQIQTLVAQSKNANPDYAPVKDFALVSLSSNSGITLNCNKEEDRYEAVNLPTGKTVPIKAVVCVGADMPALVEFVFPVLGGLQAITNIVE